MKNIVWGLIAAAVVLFTLPAYAADKKKEAAKPAAEAKKAPEVKPAEPTKEEVAQRMLTGVQNQRAWVATLEKQLDGEKKKLVDMEAEYKKSGGALPGEKTAA